MFTLFVGLIRILFVGFTVSMFLQYYFSMNSFGITFKVALVFSIFLYFVFKNSFFSRLFITFSTAAQWGFVLSYILFQTYQVEFPSGAHRDELVVGGLFILFHLLSSISKEKVRFFFYESFVSGAMGLAACMAIFFKYPDASNVLYSLPFLSAFGATTFLWNKVNTVSYVLKVGVSTSLGVFLLKSVDILDVAFTEYLLTLLFLFVFAISNTKKETSNFTNTKVFNKRSGYSSSYSPPSPGNTGTAEESYTNPARNFYSEVAASDEGREPKTTENKDELSFYEKQRHASKLQEEEEYDRKKKAEDDAYYYRRNDGPAWRVKEADDILGRSTNERHYEDDKYNYESVCNECGHPSCRCCRNCNSYPCECCRECGEANCRCCNRCNSYPCECCNECGEANCRCCNRCNSYPCRCDDDRY
ncbi:hypothetical protein ACQKIC_15955 [Peribacillus sp. NPDC046944]|uniref:hypothetical protein n=1 Tax=unclassified Peribacillus TaxID=2675266 RepID=UPI003D066B3E